MKSRRKKFVSLLKSICKYIQTPNKHTFNKLKETGYKDSVIKMYTKACVRYLRDNEETKGLTPSFFSELSKINNKKNVSIKEDSISNIKRRNSKAKCYCKANTEKLYNTIEYLYLHRWERTEEVLKNAPIKDYTNRTLIMYLQAIRSYCKSGVNSYFTVSTKVFDIIKDLKDKYKDSDKDLSFIAKKENIIRKEILPYKQIALAFVNYSEDHVKEIFRNNFKLKYSTYLKLHSAYLKYRESKKVLKSINPRFYLHIDEVLQGDLQHV